MFPPVTPPNPPIPDEERPAAERAFLEGFYSPNRPERKQRLSEQVEELTRRTDERFRRMSLRVEVLERLLDRFESHQGLLVVKPMPAWLIALISAVSGAGGTALMLWLQGLR